MDDKLEDYRRREENESLWNNNGQPVGGELKNLFTFPMAHVPGRYKRPPMDVDRPNDEQKNEENKTPGEESTGTTNQGLLKKLLLWFGMYIAFLYYEFASVYIVVSVLYLIWLNTRTGPKQEGEISAYSVFNKNCQSIPGTLRAEHLEAQIRNGQMF